MSGIRPARPSSIVVSAPTNIAVVKYWGKRCEKLNLPLNSSLSATLNQEHLKTTTKVTASPFFTEDEVWLNGVKQDINGNKRLLTCLSEIRRIARKQAITRGNDATHEVMFYCQKVHIHSENNFPTAAGLASSASGYAALIFALGMLYNVKGDLTTVARQGSGSACRSLHGGFVHWRRGIDDNGEDSAGVQIVPETHWPELRIFVLVVSDARKKVGSTSGMQSSARTSELLKYRADSIVETHMTLASEAIMKKDFSAFAEIIMKESNQLHAVCLDTFPPLHYLNDTSNLIIDLIHSYNDAMGSLRAAYSFDAGPNACIFTTEAHASEIAWIIGNFFPFSENCKVTFWRGLKIDPKQPPDSVLSKLKFEICRTGLLKYVIRTCLGPGPKVISMCDEEEQNF